MKFEPEKWREKWKAEIISDKFAHWIQKQWKRGIYGVVKGQKCQATCQYVCVENLKNKKLLYNKEAIKCARKHKF